MPVNNYSSVMDEPPNSLDADLKSLRIDRAGKGSANTPRRWLRWVIVSVVVLALLVAGWVTYSKLNVATEVETLRARTNSTSAASGGDTILNATGYIIAAHRIEVASKVVGRVAWIGVEKGDRVTQGQVLARLEDDEYRAQVLQAEGNLENLKMNASVAFHSSDTPDQKAETKPPLTIPASAVRDGAVFLVVDGKAVRRQAQVTGASPQGVIVASGLNGGWDRQVRASPRCCT
jgi:HlyD family secretion protein